METTTTSMDEFWGAALTKTKKEFQWEAEDDSEDSLYTEKTLELRQACLGVGAKEGERNVVELTTENDEGEDVTHTILSMRVGGVEQSSLFLTLRPPVTFKLAEGSGPIHLVGQINESIDMDMLDEDSDDDDEDDEEVNDIGTKIKGTAIMPQKRPAPVTSATKSPAAKVAKIEDDEEDDSEEEEEEDEEDEDMSDEEDEDEDEDEEESEQENVPPPKKSQSNSKSRTATPHSKAKPGSFKTPQTTPGKPQKGSAKGARSLPNTPKLAGTQSNKKKTPSGKGTPDLNEIKERLTKMSVPKKLEKFNNFVSNSFKIKDPTVTKQLWEYVQKNRPEK